MSKTTSLVPFTYIVSAWISNMKKLESTEIQIWSLWKIVSSQTWLPSIRMEMKFRQIIIVFLEIAARYFSAYSDDSRTASRSWTEYVPTLICFRLKLFSISTYICQWIHWFKSRRCIISRAEMIQHWDKLINFKKFESKFETATGATWENLKF
jgi:hypothetical protein